MRGVSEKGTATADYGDNLDRDKWIYDKWLNYTRGGMESQLKTLFPGRSIGKTAQQAALKTYCAFRGVTVPRSTPGRKRKST